MTFTKIVDGLAGAISKARGRLDEVNHQIADIEAEQTRIALLPPHTDDIIAALIRGLEEAGGSFEHRLSWYLNNENATDANASRSVDSSSGQLLSISRLKPSWGGLFPPSNIGENTQLLDFAAVTYFLRDQIAAEIPALVSKLCPAADAGLKSAEREDLLTKIASELEGLQLERDELASTLDAARLAVSPSDE